MAAGKVCTGFSLPYVAKYSATGTTVSYTNGQKLARGVDVSMEASAADDNNFYADNLSAESSAGKFSTGTVNLTVDGLLAAARKLILGLPAAGEDGFVGYGDNMVVPYVGIAYIRRFQSDGVVSYEPTILPKCRFNIPAEAGKTQEKDIDWQTESLTAAIVRDDTANHNWKYGDQSFDTEAEAESAIKEFFSIT